MTSASTLSRQAAILQKKGLGKVAKRMREKAAKMRRDGRKGKKPHPAVQQRAERQIADLDRIAGGAGWRAADSNALNQMSAASVDSMAITEQPGRGEIVGGRIAAVADGFAKLARKKGGIDTIQSQLSSFESNARYEGARSADERTQKVAQEANERWRENIVTGFMARMAGLERMHRNGLPEAIVVDGVTLARVCDALAAAGYTTTGKR